MIYLVIALLCIFGVPVLAILLARETSEGVARWATRFVDWMDKK